MEGGSYARAMLKAKYCLVPASDHGASAGARLYDAIAAGCVPLIIDCEKIWMRYATVAITSAWLMAPRPTLPSALWPTASAL